MNKKGVTFTYITMLFLVVVLLLFSIYTRDKTTFETEMTTVVAENMDQFSVSLQNDYIPAALRASTVKSIKGLEENIIATQQYVSGDVTEQVRNVLLNGNLEDGNGEAVWVENMMEGDANYTLDNIAGQVEQLAHSSGLNLQFEKIDPSKIKVYQKDAYTIGVEWESRYKLSHDTMNITWKIQQATFTADISIAEFYAPSYLLSQNVKEEDRRFFIAKPPVTYTVPLGSEQDVMQGPQRIEESILKHYFYSNPNAPSFLKMLGGDFSADPMGISSFVNPLNYPSAGIGISGTDYNYFVMNEACLSQTDGGYIQLPGIELKDPNNMAGGGYTICFGGEDYKNLVGAGGEGHWVCESGTITCKWAPGEGTDQCNPDWNILSLLRFEEGGSTNGATTPDLSGRNMYGTLIEQCRIPSDCNPEDQCYCNNPSNAITRTTSLCKYGGCYSFRSGDQWNGPYYKGSIQTIPIPNSGGELSLEFWFSLKNDLSPVAEPHDLISIYNGIDGWRGMRLGLGRLWQAPFLGYFYYTDKNGKTTVRTDEYGKYFNTQFIGGHAGAPWYHGAITCGPEGGVKVYINGIEETAISVNEPASVKCYDDGNYYLFIGGGTGGIFAGNIDEVVLYGRELTGQEVKDHYNKNYNFCYNPV